MSAPARWDGALLRGTVHGPLPALLLLMTTVTGLVDAVSVLGLGRVFVARQSGSPGRTPGTGMQIDLSGRTALVTEWTEEIVHLVTPLASPMASATTGAAVRVDGGYVDSIVP